MVEDATQLIFPATGMVELPFLFEPQMLRCLASGPRRRPLHVLLDTGTDPSAIDLTLARRLDLRIGDFGLGQDALTDTILFTETVLPWLNLGALTIRNLYALALDLRATPFDVDIVLGYNVLRHVVLHIDYVHHTVQLSHPDLGMPVPASPYTDLPLMFFEHFPSFGDVIVGTAHVPIVTIDTGSNGGLTVGSDLAERLGIHPGAAHVSVGRGASFSNEQQAVLHTQIERMHLGPFDLHHVEVDALLTDGRGDLHRAGRANMGNRLLARFASVTIDYRRERCRIVERPPSEEGARI